MAWLDEVRKRIAINEGVRQRAYLDDLGIKTIGIGFNCTRTDTRQALAKSGVTDIDGVLGGVVALTTDQINALFNYSFNGVVSCARASLAPGIFDSLTDARRFVIVDIVFQMGEQRWLEFVHARSLLNTAQDAKNRGDIGTAHAVFMEAANALIDSEWYGESGDRSKRNVAMVRWGEWVSPYGDGSNEH